MRAGRCANKVLIFCFVLASCVFATSTTFADDPDAFAKVIRPAIKHHCAICHGDEGAEEGGVDLLSLNSGNLTEQTELLQSLIQVLDLHEMPPADQPPLDPRLRQKLLTELRAILHESAAKPGSSVHTPIRRLNRFQYNNAVVDLFDLKCIVFTLPERMMREHKGYFNPASGKMADVVTVGSRPLGKSQMIEPRLAGVAAFPQDLRAEHGFDNRGDHLSMSPLLMESFLKLGQTITQSEDFTPKNVGIWEQFFAAPKRDARQDDVALEKIIAARIEPFLSRAFRRSVEQNIVQRYSKFALAQIKSGASYPDAMKSVAAATIASPKFLYLYDQATDSATSQQVDNFELASRLSFFLWGSLPDTKLLEVAKSGNLVRPKVLEQQIDRMLRNRKLKRFCDSFPTQWLQLERIISSAPDREKYPNFYFAKYNNSMHMMLEPLLLFETVLIENRPIIQLIDPDFSYRSRRLDAAYGQLGTKKLKKSKGGDVTVLRFHRVPLADRRAGGIITNTAVMTMTSGSEQSKPITRGAWVAGVVFNNPPEPPPADVPALDEKPPREESHLTLRERLSLHRERADCRGCHEQIDPLGFALENYDAIGVWRETYENGREIDMQGSLFRQHEFADVAEFKDGIVEETERFARGLAGHLLSFALGRELVAFDQSALDKIVVESAKDDFKFHTLIKRVILSEPFLYSRNPSNQDK